MKKEIHPKYNQITVTCSCGNKIEVGSTLDTDLSVELCSKCHPFYTGEQKIVDSDNLVKKYEEKLSKTKGMSFKSKKQKDLDRKKKRTASPTTSSTLTLKDMLANANIGK
jgi:large subunit ribosomal protein L31